MKKRYVISIITVLLITLSFFACNKFSQKEEIIDNKGIAIYLQDENNGDNYILSELRTIPTDGYILNVEKTNSLCNGAEFSYDGENNNVSASMSKSIRCNLYFDLIDSLLPMGYKQLEYLESTGTQYIDTDLSFPSGFRIKADLMFIELNDGIFIGSHGTGSGGDRKRNFIGYHNYTHYGFLLGVGGAKVTKIMASANTHYVIDASTIVNNSYYKINGNTASISDISGQPETSTRLSSKIYLYTFFHEAYNGPTDGKSYFFIGRFYDKFSVYSTTSDNSLVAEFVPAKRMSDNKPGMYDIVRNRFFTNIATSGDDFIPGPEVN